MPSTQDRNFAVTPEVTLSAPVANAGTITFPYPSGETSTSQGWLTTGCALVDSQGNAYSTGFTVAYGASTITVTNSSLGTLATGRRFRLQANYYGIGQVALDPATYTVDASGNITGLVGAFYGSLTSGVWFKIPSIFRLRLTGTGSVTMDSKDSLGNITTSVATYSPSGATDQIEFPYAGDDAVMIRVTLTGTATAEVI